MLECRKSRLTKEAAYEHGSHFHHVFYFILKYCLINKFGFEFIVEGVVCVMKKPSEKKNGEDGLPLPPYAVYNISGGQPENLLDFVQILSEELVRAGVLPQDYDFDSNKELVPMQPGDVLVTYSDVTDLERDFGLKPTIDLRTGLRHFAEWYKEFYK